MKAYNEQWIYNRSIVQQADRWYRQRLLTDEQQATIRNTYPVEFRQTNGYMEIGLFLFTTLVLLSTYLLLSMLFSISFTNQHVYGVFNISMGIVVGGLGQWLIRRQLFYRNGVDNAFVVLMTGFLAFGLNQLLPNGLPVVMHCLVTLPLLAVVLWYYGDTLITFLTLGTFYALVVDGILRFSWGRSALPFVLMGVSLGLYGLMKQIDRRISGRDASPQQRRTQTYYADPINLVQWLALLVLGANGNYFVARELNGVLLSGLFTRRADPEIALSGLFWLLTFGIPIVYLWQGLTKKNRMLIILGTLGLIAAVATVHNYLTLLPLNVSLTLGGGMLMAVAVVCIRYLSRGGATGSRHGFTDAPDDDSPNEFFTAAQTLTTMQATAGTQQAPNQNVRLGGGDFGGAGSEGTY